MLLSSLLHDGLLEAPCSWAIGVGQCCTTVRKPTRAPQHPCALRAMDRYPASGRLLRAYGRFLEWVRNDPSTAQRCYLEALRKGTTESLLGLAGNGADGEAAQLTIQGVGARLCLCADAACLRAPHYAAAASNGSQHASSVWQTPRACSASDAFASSNFPPTLTKGMPLFHPPLCQALGKVDENTDGIVIINAIGSILAVNKASQELWGYEKGELEGKNVSTLMWVQGWALM